MSRKLKIAREVLSEACSFLLSGYTPFCGVGLFHLFATLLRNFACVEDEIKSCAKKKQHKISADSSGRLLA